MNYLKLLTLTKPKPTAFTLLEILFTSVLLGVIAAIGVPYFFKTIELQNLKGASDKLYQAISEAQARSMNRKENWQVSFRVSSGIVQYAYHSVSLNPATSTAIQWTSLPKQIQIDSETDILQLNSIYQLCFNEQGLPTTVLASTPRSCTSPPAFTPAQITLYNSNSLSYKRCVVITTILGAIKTGQDQSVPKNGKYCY